MVVPTVDRISLESLNLATLEDQVAQWCSPSSLSPSSATCSSTGFTDCPTMSKSLTDSLSSDTQTENETPPETPDEGSHLQTTPVLRTREPRFTESICRPDLHAAYASMYSEPGDGYAGSDEGYETECESKQSVRRAKRSATRRKALDRSAFRRRGEPSGHSPSLGARTRIMPSAIEPPATAPPVFGGTSPKATFDPGLELGIASTRSAVRSAPNCAHRSSADSVPSPSRSRVPVSHADLLLPVDSHLTPLTPMKPQLNPVSLPHPGDLSPLDLNSAPTPGEAVHPVTTATAATDSSAPLRPHQAAFFPRGAGLPADLLKATYGPMTAVFLTLANHAQSERVQVSAPRRGIPKGPPSRGSPLPPTQAEVCPGDAARGIRRFAAMKPHCATVGYRVTSG
ncbi:hypothetical protein JB92DRAFT_2998964 [Gautieria morchelliformis]|nr:hypothetical protein JB92DRAFT_2998964 [Gautieria morchelliformis]